MKLIVPMATNVQSTPNAHCGASSRSSSSHIMIAKLIGGRVGSDDALIATFFFMEHLNRNAASAVMRLAAKPGVPGKETWSG